MRTTKNNPPCIGDIRLKNVPPPASIGLAQIKEFEIWDGEKWVDAKVGNDTKRNIQVG